MICAHQLLWTGFLGLDPAEVALPFDPGGIILFARNLDPDPLGGPARCRRLIDGLQARFGSELPLAVAVDQEGGAVSRLRPWTGPTPSLRRLWTRDGARACSAWGALWGEGLRMLGFNVDFAPVLDLWDGHPGAGIGDRAASEVSLEAAAAAGAFLHGLESAGVRGCLKHFPGRHHPGQPPGPAGPGGRREGGSQCSGLPPPGPRRPPRDGGPPPHPRQWFPSGETAPGLRARQSLGSPGPLPAGRSGDGRLCRVELG